MKAKYTHPKPYRDDKHKFVTGQVYDLDKQTIEKFANRFEIISEPKTKKEVSENGS